MGDNRRQISLTTEKSYGFKKVVCTRIDSTYYLMTVFIKKLGSTDWVKTFNPSQSPLANGEIRTRVLHDVDEYFDLLIEYEGFEEVADNEKI